MKCACPACLGYWFACHCESQDYFQYKLQSTTILLYTNKYVSNAENMNRYQALSDLLLWIDHGFVVKTLDYWSKGSSSNLRPLALDCSIVACFRVKHQQKVVISSFIVFCGAVLINFLTMCQDIRSLAQIWPLCLSWLPCHGHGSPTPNTSVIISIFWCSAAGGCNTLHLAISISLSFVQYIREYFFLTPSLSLVLSL